MKFLIKSIMLLGLAFFCTQIFADTTTTTTTVIDNAVPPASAVVDNTAPTIADSAIITNVTTALTQNPQLAGTNLTVTSSNGMVTINGTAISQSQVDLAVSAARSVTGVKDVQANITMKPTR